MQKVPQVRMMDKKIELFGVWFSRLYLEEVLRTIASFIEGRRPCYVVTPNVDFLMQARRDHEFQQVLNSADLCLCDSVPIFWVSKLLGTPLKARIAGSDLLPALCEVAARKGYRVYFLGAAPGVAAKAAKVLKGRYPGLQVVGVYSPPMGFSGDQRESEEIIDRIRNAAPDILFVGMGTPKQEFLIHRYKAQLKVPVSIGVGAAFDFTSGVLKRAPVSLQRVGLEWLYRLCQEPRRLWRRYLFRDTPFVAIVFWKWIRARLVRFRPGGRCVADSRSQVERIKGR